MNLKDPFETYLNNFRLTQKIDLHFIDMPMVHVSFFSDVENVLNSMVQLYCSSHGCSPEETGPGCEILCAEGHQRVGGLTAPVVTPSVEALCGFTWFSLFYILYIFIITCCHIVVSYYLYYVLW